MIEGIESLTPLAPLITRRMSREFAPAARSLGRKCLKLWSSIRLSILPCPQKLICSMYLMNIMKSTRYAVMASTALHTGMSVPAVHS